MSKFARQLDEGKEVHLVKGDTDFLISGNICFETVTQLRTQGAQLINNAKSDIQFNFQSVTFADSSGLALLLAWLRQAKTMKKAIHFTHIPQSMMEMAHTYDIDKFLPFSLIELPDASSN